MGSNFGLNFVIAKEVEMYNYCCYVRCANLLLRVIGECLGPKRLYLFTMNSDDFQTKVMQSKGWLSAIVGMLVPRDLIKDLTL